MQSSYQACPYEAKKRMSECAAVPRHTRATPASFFIVFHHFEYRIHHCEYMKSSFLNTEFIILNTERTSNCIVTSKCLRYLWKIGQTRCCAKRILEKRRSLAYVEASIAFVDWSLFASSFSCAAAYASSLKKPRGLSSTCKTKKKFQHFECTIPRFCYTIPRFCVISIQNP